MVLEELLIEYFSNEQLSSMNLNIDAVDKKVGYLLWSLTKDNQHLGAEKDDYTVAVWEAVKKFSEVFDIKMNKNPSGYLFKIIERKVLDYHRHLTTQKFSALNDGMWYTNNYNKFNDYENENVIDVLSENFILKNHEENKMFIEIEKIAEQILKQITDEKQHLVIEKWIEGFNVTEIVKQINFSRREVNKYISSFKDNIKKYFV